MKDTEYSKLIELRSEGNVFIPANENAQDFLDSIKFGQLAVFQEVTKRDVKFHRCYFSLLNYIYAWMPSEFKNAVPENKFYQFLKHLKSEYKVIFKFNDGTQMVEYDSISFGKMSQHKFESYVRDQLPWIYENVIGAYYYGNEYNRLIANIEDEYLKFLSKL